MLRRYWHPVCFSHELRDVPIAVRMLGEDLVLFRDGSGKPGLLGLHCSHRLGSLEYGQVKNDGLMCSYHGWRYDTQGHLIDAPLEPADSPLKRTVTHPWYPVRDWAGILWTYMGPEKENPPPLPGMDVLARHITDGVVYMSRGDIRNYNYLNWLENFADQGHVPVLHTLTYRDVPEELTPYCDLTVNWNRYPQLYNAETEYGLKHVAVWDTGDPGVKYVNVWSIAMPTHWRFSSYPGAAMDFSVDRREGGGMLRIIDDTHFELFRCFLYREGNWMPPRERNLEERGLVTVTKDGFRIVPPPEIKFAGAKAAYDHRRYAGFEGDVKAEDLVMQETQGALYDRGEEHLGKSDSGVILLRKVWRDAMEAVTEGRDPKGAWREDRGVLEVDTYRGPLHVSELHLGRENLPSFIGGKGLIRDESGNLVFGGTKALARS
jgi:phenylpropionate dioxygenase-like ring-hydroxylating dioxygenase large terminal subunit